MKVIVFALFGILTLLWWPMIEEHRLAGRQPIYNNSAKNTAMYVIKFERNAKDGLKSTVILENDNTHLQLKLD